MKPVSTLRRTFTTFLATALLAAGLGLSQPLPAQALDFNFEFTGVFGIPGTVTGRILGLSDNVAGQAATSVIIDSIPIPSFSPIGSVPNPPGSFGSDAVLWDVVSQNNFNVVGGIITLGDFGAQTSSDPGFQRILLEIGDSPLFFEDFSQDGSVVNDGIESLQGQEGGLTVTPLFNNQVPEPNTMILLGTGLAGIIAWRRKNAA